MTSVEAASWWDAHEPLSVDYLESLFSCRAACPVGTNAGGYVSLIAQGQHEEAYRLARGPNPFASVCGRICAAPCEKACRRGAIDAPIGIRALKRVLCERYGVESGRPFEEILKHVERPRPPAPRPGRVAIVGAGPAGLACAHDLALMGHKAVVFDAAPQAGGMMRLGIPEYRLPRNVLSREVEFVKWLGVEIRLGVEIGLEVTFEDLVKEHDAIFLAPGCRKGKALRLPGAEQKGVLTAVDFLAHTNLGLPLDLGARVVVVGGGSVAYDAARTVWRMELPEYRLASDAALVAARMLRREVTMVALESRTEMPADPRDMAEGAEESIKVLYRRGPKTILSSGGTVTALQTLDVARVFDEQGRFAPKFVPGTEREISCDTVILAVGQVADLSFLGEKHGLRTTPQNLIAVDPETLSTSQPGVYAGGDVAFGPRIVIQAVADGRRAARSIDTQLTGRVDEPRRFRVRVFDTFGYDHPFARGDYEKIPRRQLPLLPVEQRARAAEVERTLTAAEVRLEGSRCLHCWVHTIFDSSRAGGSECIQCGGCVDVCPEQCIVLSEGPFGARPAALVSAPPMPPEPPRAPRSESAAPLNGTTRIVALLKDETACIRCGLCARRCPVGVITMQGLHRENEAPAMRLAEGVI